MIKPLGQDKIKVLLQQQLSLVNMVLHPQYVHCVAWFPPPAVKITSQILKKSPIIFLRNGELSMIKPLNEGEYEHAKLSSLVEFFWLSRNEERIADLYNSLWAFNGTGVKVFFRYKEDLDQLGDHSRDYEF